jgi:5'-nucleotidase
MTGNSMTKILLTNDDGIESPGLWAIAASLCALGEVTILAPSQQWSSAGRSLPRHTSGMIREVVRPMEGCAVKAFAVDGSPAQAVLYALLEIMPAAPDLVVSGINYGENIGSGLTISGTVGAALEAASAGIPALAVSMETPVAYHHSNSDKIDFSVAAFFGALFAGKMLRGDFYRPDIDVVKVEVPFGATQATPWKMARASRQRYYVPTKPRRDPVTQHATIPYQMIFDPNSEPESDLHALLVDKLVTVTPLSMDLTARVDLRELDRSVRDAEMVHAKADHKNRTQQEMQ